MLSSAEEFCVVGDDVESSEIRTRVFIYAAEWSCGVENAIIRIG